MIGTTMIVSIHAPVKGRPCRVMTLPASIRFNPRPREGATLANGFGRYGVAVSIHAPVKGRHSKKNKVTITAAFQSTPP